MDHPPRILFLTLTNDPGSDRIVSHLGREGAECGVLGAAGSFAAQSRFVRRQFRLPAGGAWLAALSLRRRLQAIVEDWRPDLVMPLDDMAAQLLRALHGARRSSLELRDLLVRSLGAPEHYRAACGRDALMRLAAKIEIRVPAHRAVPSLPAALAAAAAFGYPVVLKREQTCGGGGVTIADGPASLARAFRRGQRKIAAKRPLQQLFGRGESSGGMTLQKFLPGQLAMRTVACRDGRVLEGMSFQAETLHPAGVGASTIIRPLENQEMDGAARRLVETLGCSGVVSFDFMLGPEGDAHLIEMNPRPIGSGHLGRMFGHDIYAALLEGFSGRPRPRKPAVPARPQAIALFPKELDREPRGLGLEPAVFHDVPWDEPRIVAAYRVWLSKRHPGQAEGLGRLLAERAPRETAGFVAPLRSTPGPDLDPTLALARMPGEARAYGFLSVP